MSEPIVGRTVSGLNDLITYETSRMNEVLGTFRFIENHQWSETPLKTVMDKNEYRVLIRSLYEACDRLYLALAHQARRANEDKTAVDKAVREALRAGVQFSDNVEELAGMFLGLARRTKTTEARDFFIDVFRRLTQTAAGAF